MNTLKTIYKVLFLSFILFSIMFAEYRFIMHNLIPYTAETENVINIEIFGITDQYYIESN